MANREVGFVVDDEYKAWIANIKDRIKHSQIKASVEKVERFVYVW